MRAALIYFIHRRVALTVCCFIYAVAYIHCFNRIVKILVRKNILLKM